uniref:Mucin-4-like isoform X1 n=1 Tax=Petromyzon marinus TaxID=7757 RepID=A0AAJ7TDC1_PETMA|nr:mucin-4-like isoform X1 [Petromyzon marinus]
MDRRPCSFQTLCSRLSFVLLFMMMVGPHGVHAQHGRSKFKSSPCRIFGVFHVEAVAGMNWFSFEDAEAACVSLGASLVTKDELVRAMKEGHFEACRYGWVKEKEVYLPRVTMHRKCGRSVLGLIQSGFTSGKKYDAFCFDRNEKRKNSCEKDRKRLTITTATRTPTRRSPTSPPRTSADRRTDSTATAKPEASTPSLQPNKTNNSSEKDSKTLNITTATTASTRRSPTFAPRTSADQRTDSTATAKPEASTPSLQPNQINNSSEKDSKTLTITTATTALTRRSPTSPPRMSADRRTDSMATAKPEASTPSLQPNKTNNSSKKDSKTLNITTATTTPTRSSPTSPPRTSADRHTDSTATAKPEASTPSLQPNSTVNALASGATNTFFSTSAQAHLGDRELSTGSDLRLQSAMPSVARDAGPVSGDREASGDAPRDDSRPSDAHTNVEMAVSTTQSPQRDTQTSQRNRTESTVDSLAHGATNAIWTLTQVHLDDSGRLSTSRGFHVPSATPSVASDANPFSGDLEASGDAWENGSSFTDVPTNVEMAASSTQNLQTDTYASQGHFTVLDAALGHGSSGSGAQLLTTEGMKLEPSNTQDWKHPVLIILIFVAVVIATAAFCVLKCRRKKKTKRFPVETSIPLSIKVKVNAKAVDGGESEKQCMDGDVVVEVVGCRGEHASASYKEYVKGF